MYIIAAILIFGVLIAVHELGHFLAAKACGVRVNEFSIGMGPAIFHTTKGETEYSLRLLPIGGFCAMEGEDEESDDPRALERQGFWKKLLIFVAGAAMNFLTGLLIMICLYAGAQGFYTAEIVELDPAFPQQGENGIMVGDVIWAINGERIYLKSDVSTVLGAVDLDENGTIEMTVKRGGEKLKRTLTLQTYTDENGAEVRRYGFTYGGIVEATPLVRLQYSWYNTLDFVRLVRMSLMMLVSGRTGRSQRAGRHCLDHQGRGRGGAGGGREEQSERLCRGGGEHSLLRCTHRGQPCRDEPAASASARRRQGVLPRDQHAGAGDLQASDPAEI